MIENPPLIEEEALFDAYMLLSKNENAEITSLIDKINDNYEYWNDIKYKKIPNPFSSKDLWTFVKASRMQNRMLVWPQYGINLSLTNQMQRACHEFDMNFGGSWGNNTLIPE